VTTQDCKTAQLAADMYTRRQSPTRTACHGLGRGLRAPCPCHGPEPARRRRVTSAPCHGGCRPPARWLASATTPSSSVMLCKVDSLAGGRAADAHGRARAFTSHQGSCAAYDGCGLPACEPAAVCAVLEILSCSVSTSLASFAAKLSKCFTWAATSDCQPLLRHTHTMHFRMLGAKGHPGRAAGLLVVFSGSCAVVRDRCVDRPADAESSDAAEELVPCLHDAYVDQTHSMDRPTPHASTLRGGRSLGSTPLASPSARYRQRHGSCLVATSCYR